MVKIRVYGSREHSLAKLCDRLDYNYSCVYVSKTAFFFFFFFFFFSTAIVDFINCEQCICALFTVPQITHFSNLFIKNGSHSTIYTFKNYFVTVFSVSAKISSIQTHPLCPFLNKNLPFLFYIFTFQNTKHHKYQFFFIFLIIFFSHTTTIIHSFLIFEIRKEKKTKCKMNNVSVNLYGYCNINLFLHNFI